MNWGTADMQSKKVDFPAKDLDDLMSKAYQKGAIGVQHHPDNLSGSAYWKIIYRLNGIAAPEQYSWPLYIRSDLVPQRWLPGGNATGEDIHGIRRCHGMTRKVSSPKVSSLRTKIGYF